MKIILDLDGVLVDFYRGACKQHNKEFNLEDYPRGEYDIVQYLGVTVKDFWDNLFGSEFWRTLEWTDDGKIILATLEKLFGKENIVICTSPSLDPNAAKGKMQWIAEQIPDYTRRFLIGPSKHFCASPRSILIDDSDHNIEKFREAGGIGYLLPRPWNSAHSQNTMSSFTKALEQWV